MKMPEDEVNPRSGPLTRRIDVDLSFQSGAVLSQANALSWLPAVSFDTKDVLDRRTLGENMFIEVDRTGRTPACGP